MDIGQKSLTFENYNERLGATNEVTKKNGRIVECNVKTCIDLTKEYEDVENSAKSSWEENVESECVKGKEKYFGLNHKKELQDSNSFQCNYCSNVFSSWLNFVAHKKTHKDSLLMCSYCNFFTVRACGIFSHLRYVHNISLCKITVDYSLQSRAEPGQLNVPKGGFYKNLLDGSNIQKINHMGLLKQSNVYKELHFPTVDEQVKGNCHLGRYSLFFETVLYQGHAETADNSEFQCCFCITSVENLVSLKMHMRRDHLTPKIFKCEYCSFSRYFPAVFIDVVQSTHLCADFENENFVNENVNPVKEKSNENGSQNQNTLENVEIRQEFLKHKVASRKLKCGLCEFSPRNMKSLIVHMLAKHTLLKLFECCRCNHSMYYPLIIFDKIDYLHQCKTFKLKNSQSNKSNYNHKNLSCTSFTYSPNNNMKRRLESFYEEEALEPKRFTKLKTIGNEKALIISLPKESKNSNEKIYCEDAWGNLTFDDFSEDEQKDPEKDPLAIEENVTKKGELKLPNSFKENNSHQELNYINHMDDDESTDTASEIEEFIDLENSAIKKVPFPSIIVQKKIPHYEGIPNTLKSTFDFIELKRLEDNQSAIEKNESSVSEEFTNLRNVVIKKVPVPSSIIVRNRKEKVGSKENRSAIKKRDYSSKSCLYFNQMTIAEQIQWRKKRVFNCLDIFDSTSRGLKLVTEFYECQSCEMLFYNRMEYDKHIIYHCKILGTLSPAKSTQQINNMNGSIKCDICDFSADSKARMRWHKVKHHSADMIYFSCCPFCSFVERTNLKMSEHIYLDHSCGSIRKCVFCEHCYTKILSTHNHRASHDLSDEHPYICEMCKHVSLFKEQFLIHVYEFHRDHRS